MADITIPGSADVKTITGGDPNKSEQLVTCDQVTVGGDGSLQRPLHTIGAAVDGVNVRDDGTPVALATTINFAGDGVTATDAGSGVVDVTITGDGSSGDPLVARGLQSSDGNSAITLDPGGVMDIADNSGGDITLHANAGRVFVYAENAGSVRIGDDPTQDTIGFWTTVPPAGWIRQIVTGSRGGNAALASLLTALDRYGLITDNTTV